MSSEKLEMSSHILTLFAVIPLHIKPRCLTQFYMTKETSDMNMGDRYDRNLSNVQYKNVM